MTDTIINILTTDFDISFCLAVNIATWIIIHIIDDINGDKVISKWQKRIVLLIILIVLGTIYYITGTSPRIIVNSSILAPVAWSWIFKPICNKLGIDYKHINNIDN